MELNRQRTHLELIASENFVSKAVLEAAGSALLINTLKVIRKRYYGGCEFVDIAEDLARERAKAIFELIMPMFSLTPVPRQTLPSILLYWSLRPDRGMDLAHGVI